MYHGVVNISTHDLTKRSTWDTERYGNYIRISTHDLTKRSTLTDWTKIGDVITFQLTTSRRGRQHLHQPGNCRHGISTHDLTKRSTKSLRDKLVEETFQLTTSRRGRLEPTMRLLRLVGNFNSRPHEEVDGRRTSAFIIVRTFQLTTSRRGRPIEKFVNLKPENFNSRPHEEVDDNRNIRHRLQHISTHDLTKRSTNYPPRSERSWTFQLTTSRRGRRQFLRKKFSFPNYFLCLLHIIYSYYINTIFFSTLFFAKSSFFLVRIP